MFILITLHLVREVKPICNTFTVRKTDIDPDITFAWTQNTLLKFNKIHFCKRFNSSRDSGLIPGWKIPRFLTMSDPDASIKKSQIETKSQDLKKYPIPGTRISGPERIPGIRIKNSHFPQATFAISTSYAEKWGILCRFCCGRCVGVSGG